MFKYHCLNPISPVGTTQFGSNYVKTDDVNEASGILVRSASMHEMELPKSLLCVARAGAGVNNIPLDKCAEAGVVVFNTPGANANAVKELVIAGMLLAARDIKGGIDWVLDNASDPEVGKNAEKAKKAYAGTELMGKKLGIIGLGAIGIKVANTARHFGMEVYGYDPYISVDAAWNLSRDVKHVVNVMDIYTECDYITIHVPLMDATKGMISAEAIAKMKSTAVLLNFARDLLVDEQAVVDALASGKLRKYVSDFANPVTAGKPGCLVLPHLGASTDEAEDNCAEMAVKEMMDYLENGNITNSVNYPRCDMGVCENAGRIAILHKNISNMIGQFTSVFGSSKVNIQDMTNKSKGDVAYTLIDVSDPVGDDILEKISAIDGVFRVRKVK